MIYMWCYICVTELLVGKLPIGLHPIKSRTGVLLFVQLSTGFADAPSFRGYALVSLGADL